MKRHWLLAGVFWTLVALLYTLQLVYISRQPGERIVLHTALIVAVAYYLCWIPITVAVWTFSRDWVPGGMKMSSLAARHFVLAVAMVLLHSAASIFITMFLVRQMLTGILVATQFQSRLMPGLLVYVAVAGVGVAMSYYDRWRHGQIAAAQLEAQLSEARLQSLKAQLHPHFLFNTLHAVASLVRTGDNASAIKAISDLSDLLRRVLDADARPMIPLAEEAGFLERYFDIQRMRFGDRLRTSIELEPGTETIQVPAMLLQPLVENAFRHGLADRVEAGSIAVRARHTREQRLEIVVEDDGEGLPSGWTLQTQQGVGLKNTTARLAQEYRSGYEFRVEARAGGGTTATIVIPTGAAAL